MKFRIVKEKDRYIPRVLNKDNVWEDVTSGVYLLHYHTYEGALDACESYKEQNEEPIVVTEFEL